MATAPVAAARGYEVHEATEAGDGDPLQVQLDHGFISQEAAQEAVMRHWTELRRCYAQAGPATGFAGGSVTMRFVIDPAGQTSNVQVVQTRLGNFEVERCLVAIARTTIFPRPQGGAAASVEYSLEFQSTREHAVIDVEDSEVTASFPALAQQLASSCAGLGGDEVLATIYVDARGKVRSAGLAGTGPLDGEAAACLLQAIHGATIPLAGLHGSTFGRFALALRSPDLLAGGEPAAPLRRRSSRHPRGR